MTTGERGILISEFEDFLAYLVSFIPARAIQRHRFKKKFQRKKKTNHCKIPYIFLVICPKIIYGCFLLIFVSMQYFNILNIFTSLRSVKSENISSIFQVKKQPLRCIRLRISLLVYVNSASRKTYLLKLELTMFKPIVS